MITRVVALFLVVSQPALAEPVSGQLQGYAETRHYGFFGIDPDLAKLNLPFDEYGFHPDRQYGVINRIRPTLKLHLGDRATTVLTVEGHSRHGLFGRKVSEVDDIVGLERAYFTITTDWLDLVAGKQLLAWGHGLIVNPTDLFNERAANDLQAERPGVWAIKALTPLGAETNLTAAVAVQENGNASQNHGYDLPVAILRVDTAFGDIDAALQAAWDERNEEAVAGIDVKADIEVGIWAEATWTVARKSPERYFNLEMGIDYSFDVLQSLYLAVEYVHQGKGATDYDGYVSRGSPLSGAARAAFLARDTLLGIVRLGLNDKWQLQVLNVTNLHDPSGMVTGQITWLPTGALELIVGSNVMYGSRNGEYTLTLNDLRVTPTAVAFAWGRYYF